MGEKTQGMLVKTLWQNWVKELFSTHRNYFNFTPGLI